MKRHWILFAIALFVFVGLCTAGAGAGQKEKQLKVGQEAPTFMLKDLDGKWISLRDLCGKLRNPWRNKVQYYVIVSFWATYCKPCKKEIPELEEMVQAHAEDTKVLLVSIDKKGKKIVDPYIQEKKYKSTVLLDTYQRTASRYGVKAVPALFLIDKEGVFRYAAYGYEPEGVQELERVLKRLRDSTMIPDTSKKAEDRASKVSPTPSHKPAKLRRRSKEKKTVP